MRRKSVGHRVLEYLVTFFCIVTINFFLPRLMPGDPFTFLSAEEGEVTTIYSQEQVQRYMAYYGLDQPLYRQFGQYMKNLLRGYLGYSIYFDAGVTEIIKRRLLWTVSLVLASVGLSAFLGTVLGSLSAWYRGAWYRGTAIDGWLYFLMIIFSEIPPFLIGLLLLFALAAQLDLFPLSGGMTHFVRFDSWGERALDILHHAALPVLTLTLARTGEFYILARNSMISVLSRDYMRTARGKGLGEMRIIFCHALHNAILPVVTRVFLSLGSVAGGAILVENVFNYPGLGRLMRQAVMVRDYSLIQGIFLFVTLMVLVMNLFADILYKKLDPRVS